MAITYPIFTPEELANEEWRPVVSYEELYSVSNLGRVRREVAGVGLCKTGYILKFADDGRGYLQVALYKSSLKKTIKIHILVAGAFIGVRPEKYNVNHKDGIKLNNRVENLEYVTPSENKRHAHMMGLITPARGLKNGAYTHPEKIRRGDNHWSKFHPERVPRGERSGARLHPETVRRGEQIHTAKLTEADVLEIRKRTLSIKEVALKYGLSYGHAKHLRQGRGWKHI